MVVAVPVDGALDGTVSDTLTDPATPWQVAEFATPHDVNELIESIEAGLDTVSAEADVEAVGLGLAGLVDLSGRMVTAPNTAFLEGAEVGRLLRERWTVPVHVDNDANAAAYAVRAIDEPSAAHVAVIALGTGIGGGFVVDGRILRGAFGFAGEPGHMIVDVDGRTCPCGQRGCWERYASGSALTAAAADALDAGRLTRPADAPTALGPGELLSYLTLAGDPIAGELFDGFARWVAIGLANLVAVLDPEAVVICGGVAATGDELGSRVRRHLATLPIAATRPTRVRVARTGRHTSAVGAALSARTAVAGVPSRREQSTASGAD